MLKKIFFLIAGFFFGVYYYCWEFFEYFRAIIKYYRHPSFAKADSLIQIFYFFTNIDRRCYNFLKKFPASEVQYWYGETPLTTFDTICQALALTPQDTLYELGSGRGRLVFFTALVKQTRAVGIDLNPIFINRARRIKRWLHLSNVEFIEKSIMEVDLKEASIVYLYGSAFEKEALPNLMSMLCTASKGTRIATVSFPLIDYCDDNLFMITDTFWVRFVWGEAPVYIHQKLR